MSERLTDEQLRAVVRSFTEQSILAAAVNEAIALRARVARLEAALRDCKRYAEDHDDEWVPFRVDDALQEATGG